MIMIAINTATFTRELILQTSPLSLLFEYETFQETLKSISSFNLYYDSVMWQIITLILQMRQTQTKNNEDITDLPYL